MTLQARGEGLAPINTNASGESFISWLKREGYTDIKVVNADGKQTDSADSPRARRIVRTPRRTG